MGGMLPPEMLQSLGQALSAQQGQQQKAPDPTHPNVSLAGMQYFPSMVTALMPGLSNISIGSPGLNGQRTQGPPNPANTSQPGQVG